MKSNRRTEDCPSVAAVNSTGPGRELQKRNLELQKKVSQLTRDLETKNEHLRESGRELQELAKQKTAFLRKVTHDLKAHLSAIQACLSVVSDGYLAGQPKEQERMVARAGKRLNRLILLVNDLIDLAHIEGERNGVAEPVDLRQLITETTRAMRKKANGRNVELEVRLTAGLPAVLCRRRELQGVLGHIVDNAIRYSKRNSSVVVSCEAADGIRIGVEDQGIGIPREELPRIFKEFYRGKAAILHEEEGTGLGLTIVKRTMEAYGGEIEVESKTNKGTRFSLVLPVALVVGPRQEGGGVGGDLKHVGGTQDSCARKAH